MPVAWFVIPFIRRVPPLLADAVVYDRYPAIELELAGILADSGDMAVTELNNNRALVKIRARAVTLSALELLIGYRRMPKTGLLDTLLDLTALQEQSLMDELAAQGYSTTEIEAALGADITLRTMGEVLAFMCTRRRLPRWDGLQLHHDGAEHPCRPLPADLDRTVRNG